MAAAATTATAATMSVKLLIDTKAQRVLFAEVGKDMVDFLFSLLALPVATAVRLVGKDSIAGSVGNLYASVEELDVTYVLKGVAKAALLRPKTSSSSNRSLLCLPEPPPSSGPPKTKTIYICMSTGNTYGGYSYSSYVASTCRTYVTDVYGKACPSCGSSMTTIAKYLSGEPAGTESAAEKGIVQGIVMYTVLDNLKVTPMSAISSIAMLNTLAVTDIGALQEKTVQVGYNEGLAILKASLQSKTVLTDVFLGNNKNNDVIDLDNVD